MKKKSAKKSRTTDELPTLTFLTIFDAFLHYNAERKFLIFFPYESPIEYMMRQLTGLGWKVSSETCDGPDSGFDYQLPSWATRFVEALKKRYDERNKKRGQLVMSGRELRKVLMSVIRKKG